MGAGGRLRAVSRGAVRRRVRGGMAVAEARALCADLEMLDWDDAVIARAVDRATAALLEAAPQVTPAAGAAGTWWVGATGFDALGGERTLLGALRCIARRWHPEARAAVADSCVAAHVATWDERQRSGVIVPPGRDAAYLAPAPLGLVPMDAEMREALLSLGVRTAGALAALEPGDVERRWGDGGLLAWRLARGEDRRRPVLARAEGERRVEAELAAPVETTAPALFFVRAAVDRLVRDLVADGRAAAAIAVTLTLDDARGALPAAARAPGTRAHTVTREARIPRPVARAAPLVEHCRALLDGWTLTAPVSAVAVAITRTASAAAEQGDLLDGGWRDPGAADAAFARLRSALGADAVVRAMARDEHRPERAGGWEGAPAGTPSLPDERPREAPHEARAPHLTAALRLLEAPEPIDVEHTAGVPSAFWWRGCRLPVEGASGPERLSGDWWRDGYARDYWRCAGTAGAFLIYLDRGRRWYLQGWYD